MYHAEINSPNIAPAAIEKHAARTDQSYVSPRLTVVDPQTEASGRITQQLDDDGHRDRPIPNVVVCQ